MGAGLVLAAGRRRRACSWACVGAGSATTLGLGMSWQCQQPCPCTARTIFALSPSLPCSALPCPALTCPASCSFPRSCGGLLEWRNAYLLFVNLPGPGERVSAGRRYINQFLWLPAAAAAAAAAEPGLSGAADTAAGGGGEPLQQQQQQRAGEQQQEVLVQLGGEEEQEQDEQRLCMTWWPGRGQSLQHPVIQRLLAAGSAGSDHPAAAAGLAEGVGEAAGVGATAQGGELEGAEQEEEEEGEVEQQEQTAVLLFCRAGSSPFVFCGRLRPAGVGAPPEPVAPAAGAAAGEGTWGSSGIQQAAWQQPPAGTGSASIASDSGTDGGGSCCITWELTDAGSLLDVSDGATGSASSAFQQMLRPW